jgi:hypothetical protein
MRLRDIIICLLCIVLAVGLLIAAGMQLDPINRQRQDMGLMINTPEDIPPSLAFATIATGAFRGLVVDALWMRADKLKDEGQFFDARQLAEWITILQPRFASVWEFQAWNMAYNISVAIPATQPDQRWRWVRNGYELLRDQAISKYKLKNITIYRELARIFQHKIGGVSDDAHKYYKIQLAVSMEPLLRSDDNQLGPQDNRYFDALAEAPISWSEINSDPNVASLVKALKSADNTFSNDDEFVSNYLSLRQDSRRFKPEAGKVIDDFRGSGALKKFDIFAKAWQLRKVWKLDPILMQDLNKTYGPIDFSDPNTHLPLDWRHPDTHAIYWGVKGLQVAAEKESHKIDIMETNTDRIVAHSLQNLFRNGKIFIRDMKVEVPVEGSQKTQTQIYKEIFLRPDLRMFDPYNKSVLAILDKYKDDKGTLVSLQNGHRNMLKNAVFSFYQSGHKQKAQQIYNELRKLYDLPEFKVPLIEFARNRFLEELKNIGLNDAKEQVVLLLRDSYFLYAIGDDEEAYGRENMAKEVHDYYQHKYLDENRIDLPKFIDLQYLALRDFLDDKQFLPDLRLNLLNRIEIERPELADKLKPWKEEIEKQRDEIKQQQQALIKSF